MKKSNLLITIACIGFLLAGAVYIYSNYYYPSYGGGYGGYHMGWGMGLVMPLFWIFLIAGVVALFRRTTCSSRET